MPALGKNDRFTARQPDEFCGQFAFFGGGCDDSPQIPPVGSMPEGEVGRLIAHYGPTF